MALPLSLLNRLRYVNALVFLCNKVKVYRPETFNDEFGGTYTDYRLVGTFDARFVHDSYKEGPVGEGIQPSDEYRFVFGMNPGIEYMDKLVIPDDNHKNRYFEVISVDDTTSEGMFNTAKAVERYN